MENTTAPRKGFAALNALQKFYTYTGIVLCLCGIAEFIVWIIDTTREHLTTEKYMGVGFLTLTVGTLLFLLIRPSSKGTADTILWITIVATIVLNIIGITLGQ